jgi:hypothetical protein
MTAASISAAASTSISSRRKRRRAACRSSSSTSLRRRHSRRAGYAFNKYIAVEVEGGIGGAKSEYGSNGNTDGKIGMKNSVAAHAVVTLPFSNSGAYALGKVGYTSYTLEREYQGQSAPDLKASGPSVGAGIGFRGGSIDYRMEYSYVSSNDGNSGVLGLTVMKRF